jgi:hypothetical protein
MEQNDNGTLQLEKVDLLRSIYETENSVDTLMRVGVYEARTVHGVQTNSGCCTIAAYIYVPFSAQDSIFQHIVRLHGADIEGGYRKCFWYHPRSVSEGGFVLGILRWSVGGEGPT